MKNIYTAIAALLCGADSLIKYAIERNHPDGELRPALHGKIIIRKFHNKGAMLNLTEAALFYEQEKIELTKNEFKILQVLMENKQKVVSRDTLMVKLWESDSFVDENTLSVNVNRLRKKLESVGLCDFIVTRKGIGYQIG